MPRLFAIKGSMSGKAYGSGQKRQASARFLPGAPRVQAPEVGISSAPRAMRIPSNIQLPQFKDPFANVVNAATDYMEVKHTEALKLKDEQDRVAASRAVRQYEERLHVILRGDPENEPGYLYLDGYDAVDRRKEYEDRINAAFEAGANTLNPNARRYAADKMMARRHTARRELSAYHLQSHRYTQQAEREKQYQGLMSRLDDHIDQPGEAFAEIAAYAANAPEEERPKALSKVISDFVSLAATKDPQAALPLLEEIGDLADPVFDVASRTHYNKTYRKVANSLVAREEKLRIANQERVDLVRKSNELQMFRDMHTASGPDIAKYANEAMAGRMSISTYNTLKKQWENRNHLPPITAEEEYALKQEYLSGRMSAEDIVGLERRQSDKDRIVEYITDLEASDRRDEVKYYSQYIGAMIKAKDIHPMFGSDTAVMARNAEEAYRKMIRDPSNQASPFEVANQVLNSYGIDFTELDKTPSIVVPGGSIYRPRSYDELREAVMELRDRDEAGLVNPAEKKAFMELAERYQDLIKASQFREKKRELDQERAEKGW